MLQIGEPAMNSITIGMDLGDKINLVYVLDEPGKMKHSTSIDNTMIALSDLEKIYGKELKAYSLSAYAIDPEATVDYWSVIHNNQTLNFRLGETKYRRNMERYKTDVLSIARTQDQRLLDAAPEFSVAPYEKDGEVFVPLVEAMDVLMESVEIVDCGKAGRRSTK